MNWSPPPNQDHLKQQQPSFGSQEQNHTAANNASKSTRKSSATIKNEIAPCDDGRTQIPFLRAFWHNLIIHEAARVYYL